LKKQCLFLIDIFAGIDGVNYTSGIVVPKAFLEKQPANAMVYKLNSFCQLLVRNMGFDPDGA